MCCGEEVAIFSARVFFLARLTQKGNLNRLCFPELPVEEELVGDHGELVVLGLHVGTTPVEAKVLCKSQISTIAGPTHCLHGWCVGNFLQEARKKINFCEQV